MHKQPDRRGGSAVALLCTGKLTTGAILLLQCHHAFTAWWQCRAVLCFAVQFAAPKAPLSDADFSDLMVGEDPATRKAALKAQLANLKEVRPLQAACLCTDLSLICSVRAQTQLATLKVMMLQRQPSVLMQLVWPARLGTGLRLMDWVKEVWAGGCTGDRMAYPQCCSGRQLANVKDVTVPCIDPNGVCVLWLQEEEGWKRVLEEHKESALPGAEAQLPGQAGHAAAAQEERQDTALHNAKAELPSQTGDVAAALEGHAPEAAEGDPACYPLLC